MFAKSKLISQNTLGNNTWLIAPQDADTVFVFVHGVLSSSSACWTSNNQSFWPSIVASDIAFNNPAIYLSGYHTRIDSAKYDIRQCAIEVFDGLKNKNNLNKSVFDYENIIFICHSLGGIVVRRLLEENYEKFKDKAIGLVLIASPTLGSSYAALLNPISFIYQHKIARLLRSGSEILEDINERFKKLIYERRIPLLRGAEAVEEHAPITFSYLPALIPRVVSGKSASNYFGPTQIIAGTDHFSICKPESVNHGTHNFLRKFYEDQYLPVKKENIKIAKRDLSHLELNILNRVLFDIYTESCENFYLKRQVDDQIRRSVDNFSIWLSGSSGSGKTSIIKRYIKQSQLKPFEITFSHVDGDSTDQDCWIREISESFGTSYSDSVARKFSFNEIVDVISEYSKKSVIPLFVDEVPLSSCTDTSDKMVGFIANLLDGVKRKSGGGARFIICSINSPPSNRMSEKFRDQFQLIEIGPWSTWEIKDLINLICESLPNLSIGKEVKDSLASNVNGSPRSVKRFFRMIYLRSESTEFSAADVLNEFLRDEAVNV